MSRPLALYRFAAAALLLACLGAPASSAESEPTPDGTAWLFDPPTDGPAVRLAQNTQTLVDSPPPPAPSQRRGPPGGRRGGILQGVDLIADYAPRLDDDSLGRTSFSASVSVGVPPFVLGTPLMITPRVGLHLLDGPEQLDAPARVNDFELSIGTFKKLSDRWSASVSVNVGVYGDDYSLDDADALRLSGMAFAIYEATPEWKWTFGAAYLNRDDIAVIPAVGVIYDPGYVRYELIMPRPRIVWRLPQDASGVERSFYVSGEIGGGAWAVRRTDGTTDTLNLSRWGVLVGYETGSAFGAGAKCRYEFGYLFARDLEYAESGEEFSLDDSLVARVAWSY